MEPDNSTQASLNDLADEIIQQILCFLPADSIRHVLQTSKRLSRIANEPTLWRTYCRADFQYWDESHEIRRRFAASVSSTDWKELYLRRRETDRKTTRLLNKVLAGQTHRIATMQAITGLGYDAKDTLLRHLRVGDDAEDVLARRHFSRAILGQLHRLIAIQEWSRVRKGHPTSLERALIAFDMFVIHDSDGDFDSISRRLDALAQRVQQESPMGSEMSTRAKALTIARFLRTHNLTGLGFDVPYRALKNNFIGVALSAQTHPSLPLISVAIFCSIAERLGVDARPCGFPHHVYAITYPPAGLNLDGDPISSDEGAKPMYLDPFSSQEETPVEDLYNQLERLRLPPSLHPKCLAPATILEIVIRTARNIWFSVRELRRRGIASDTTGNRVLSVNYNLDLESAYYGAQWVLVSSCHPDDMDPRVGMDWWQTFTNFVRLLETKFPEDAWLLERDMLPLFPPLIANLPEHERIVSTVTAIRSQDATPKVPHPRNADLDRRVRYRVGQLFRHHRYGYIGVITGWTATCEAPDEWIHRNNVNSLRDGRQQSFYHVLVEDRTARYVAEENIEVLRHVAPPAWILEWAGLYFKRWDRETGAFVSNVRDEYPDD